MRAFSHRLSSRGVASLLGCTLVFGLLSACSSPDPKREYVLPNSLCGIKISGTALEPFLPPGKKINAQPTSAVGINRCRLRVDGKIVFSSSIEQRDIDATARDVAMSAFGVNPNDTGTTNGRFVYSKTGAVGRVECPNSTVAEANLWVTARVPDASSASGMRHFIEEYAAATAKSGACRRL
ncbi:hypothetical protein [Streptomyces sp. NPDC059262]|uniref:hypothetical protein n=1 Tax=Streptomyces sp. NPDC059262 TaxID=3346797 RepID=UPI00369591FA